MKMILRSSVVVVALFGVYFWGLDSKQPPINDKESLVLQGLMQAIEYAHMTPKKVDDELSKTVFKTYMERIDGAKRYLNQKDIDKLKKYELLLDDQINGLTFEFFNESLPMLDAGMEKAQKYFTEAIDGKITFEKGADYETDPDKMKYATNDSELKVKWKNIVQWEVTTRWVEKIEEQEEKEVKEGLKSEEELKVEVIKEVKKRYDDFFDRVKKLRRSDRMETYLGSIANYFDPHTDYFSPKDKQDFDINMGGKLEGIGARLQTSELTSAKNLKNPRNTAR